DVLTGRVNPSGKLTITFPASTGHLPSHYNRKFSSKLKYAVDYREYLYPFGYGLSYTTFEYNNLRIEPATINANEKALVTLEITNTGKVAGDEIVQMYIRDLISSV